MTKDGGHPRPNNFSDINKLIEEMFQNMMSEGFPDIQKLQQAASKEPIVYGFNIKISSEGKPMVESFGNVKPTQEKVELTENREPIVDVINRAGETAIIAELPGMEGKDVKVTAEPMKVMIEGRDGSGSYGYNKGIKLDAEIRPETGSATLRNGILEVTFKRGTGGKAADVKINA